MKLRLIYILFIFLIFSCKTDSKKIFFSLEGCSFSNLKESNSEYYICGISGPYNKKFYEKHIENEVLIDARINLIFSISKISVKNKFHESNSSNEFTVNNYNESIKKILSRGNYESIIMKDQMLLSNYSHEYEDADYEIIAKIIPGKINWKKFKYVEVENNRSILIAEVSFQKNDVNKLIDILNQLQNSK